MIAYLFALWALLFPYQGLDANVIIEIPGVGHGSGTFISPTQVVTAKHVALEYNENMRVRGPEGDLYRIVKIDNGPADISIITVDRPLRGTPRPVSCEMPYRGEVLYYFGSPSNIEFVGPLRLEIMDGAVVGDETSDIDLTSVIFTDGESEPGVSGSGVMNASGEVVGVYTMAWGQTTFGGFVSLSDPTVCAFVKEQVENKVA